MALVSYREYARMKNLTLGAIQDRLRKGTITENAIARPGTDLNSGRHPKIDPDIADADFLRNGDHLKKATVDVHLGKKMEEPGPRPEVKPIEPKPATEVKETPKPIKAEVTKEVVNGQEVKVEKEPYRGESEGQRYMGARATTEELKSRKIYLEVMELEGRLIDKDDVRNALETTIHETRSAILNVADKISMQVLGKKDLLEVKTIIKFAINEALANLQKIENDF